VGVHQKQQFAEPCQQAGDCGGREAEGGVQDGLFDDVFDK